MILFGAAVPSAIRGGGAAGQVLPTAEIRPELVPRRKAVLPLPASLDGACVIRQIDVGCGDRVDQAPKELAFPTLPPLEAPVVRTYPPEAVIAEKFRIRLSGRQRAPW